MIQADLNRQVARATGESVCTVKRLGFLLDGPVQEHEEIDLPHLGPNVIDWDSIDLERQASGHRGLAIC